MAEKIRVVHYLNQFFAQIGEEEKADIGSGFNATRIGQGIAERLKSAGVHGVILTST
jgi:Glycine/sarcosine/betaine reductase selenoprotein B (GRDB)